MSRRASYPPVWLVSWGLLLATALLSLTLLPVDETRYVGVAWEMFHSGHYLVPLNNGDPYPHKPPLLFWLIQAGWLVWGVNDWWPRLAAGLYSLLGLFLTLRLARLLWPQRDAVAYLAPTILLSCLLWSLWTPAVMFDLLLACCVLIAVLGIVLASVGKVRSGWLLAGFGIGLGILAKGPVILLHVLPVATLAPLWHPQRQRLQWKGWYTGLLAAVAIGSVIALSWAVPAALQGGSGYAKAIFWGQSAGRLVDSFAHRRPFYWYLPLLPLVLFPWSLWPPLWRALETLRRNGDWPTRLLLAWIIPTFAGFSLISGKQAHYLLPLFPGFALLAARGLEDVCDHRGWRDQWPICAVMLLIAGILLWVPLRADAYHLPGWVAAISPFTALAVAACALFLLLPIRTLEGQTRTLAGVTIALVAVLLTGIGGQAAPYYDLRGAARFIATAQDCNRPIAHVGKYHDSFQFLGRLTQPVAVISPDQVLTWARTHPRGILVAYFAHRLQEKGAAVPLYSQPYRSQWLTIWAAAVIVQRPKLLARMD